MAGETHAMEIFDSLKSRADAVLAALEPCIPKFNQGLQPAVVVLGEGFQIRGKCNSSA